MTRDPRRDPRHPDYLWQIALAVAVGVIAWLWEDLAVENRHMPQGTA